MKTITSAFSIAALTVIGFVSPAIAGGAPQCFLDRPQTCSSYDYIEESINANGQLCKTRYFNSGSTQSAIGLGCVEVPKQEPEKPKFQETCSTTDTSDPKKSWSCVNSQGFIVEYNPTQTTQEPKNETKATTSPVVIGDRNTVSTITNTTNNNISSVINSSVNNVLNTNITSNTITKNDMRVITVNGGYLVIGENGFGKFFPTKAESVPLSDEESDEVVYLERSELPKSISRSVDRLPEAISAKKSLRLPAALRNAESITEDVCSVSNRKLETLARGTCVLEIPVGEGIYEHEIKVTK